MVFFFCYSQFCSGEECYIGIYVGMYVSCTHTQLYDWQQLECVVKHVAVVFLDIQLTPIDIDT